MSMILFKSKSITRFKCITRTAKYQIKKGEFPSALLAPLATSLVKPVLSSVVNGIKKKRKRLEKELQEQKEDTWIKFLSSALSFKQYRDY